MVVVAVGEIPVAAKMLEVAEQVRHFVEHWGHLYCIQVGRVVGTVRSHSSTRAHAALSELTERGHLLFH